MDTNKNKVGQLETVEVLMLGDKKWVLAESLHKTLSGDTEYKHWRTTLIQKFKFEAKRDYIKHKYYGYLFSLSAAMRIIDTIEHKLNVAAEKAKPKKRLCRGIEVDEYGLPVHPPRPPKHGRRFINPYDLTR